MFTAGYARKEAQVHADIATGRISLASKKYEEFWEIYLKWYITECSFHLCYVYLNHLVHNVLFLKISISLPRKVFKFEPSTPPEIPF